MCSARDTLSDRDVCYCLSAGVRWGDAVRSAADTQAALQLLCQSRMQAIISAVRHRDILRHNLISSFREFSPRGPWIFQQDNARFHTTPETISYLHGLGITWLEWPAWSPDLNPIENFWSELKARVYSRFPQTMEELEQFIREEWDATGLTYINKLCRSMPRRLQLLLENEGHKIAF